MLDTVKKLCALSGVSGWEDEVRDAILLEAMEWADSIETDAMGNLYAYKKGSKSLDRPVMLAAHMDEVGLIVTGYRDEGFLRFQFVGGVDRRVVLGKRVFVGPCRVPGVIGLKAIHLVPKSERETVVPRLEDLYIDIGAESEEEARGMVSLGERGVFDPGVVEFGGGFIKAKALDDRVGCAVLLELLKRELPVDVCCVFTVQEEVGCRGAVTAANRLCPSFALALDSTTAADIGGVEEGRQVCRLGRGVVIPFMDGGTVYSPALYRAATRSAEKRGILWQTKELVAGGTDASSIQRSGGGVRVLSLSAPLRNIHSPASVGYISDIMAMPGLCLGILEDYANGDYDV
ncbi:MAG: M42 family peptidase [Oscillospiraceae bacterium]|nr:M42 family peptidase [Oscillospiraceae bacterium]